jgi:hypothetical protein
LLSVGSRAEVPICCQAEENLRLGRDSSAPLSTYGGPGACGGLAVQPTALGAAIDAISR